MANHRDQSTMNLAELQTSLDSLHRHDEVFDPNVDDFIFRDSKVAIQHGQRQRPGTYWRAQCSMRGLSDQGTIQDMQSHLRNRNQDADASLRQTQSKIEKIDVPDQAWKLVDQRLKTEKTATQKKNASISRAIAKNSATTEFDITGDWTISSKLQDHPDCPESPPIINRRGHVFPQYWARFDFGIVQGVMRMSKNKPWSIEGPVMEDMQLLGWVYRWRGHGVVDEAQCLEKKLYRIIFSPDGKDLYGKFSSAETSLVSFSGRKLENGRSKVKGEGSKAEWNAFRKPIVRR